MRDLHKKIRRKGGVAVKDLKARPGDYYDPSMGSVPGLIYYSDTVAFAKKNHIAILERLDELRSQGVEITPPNIAEEGEGQYYNWLTWFAWGS